MTVVIFGGAGFVGRHLAQSLDLAGAGDVLLADLTRPAFGLPEGVRFAECDVRKPISMPVDTVDRVYNLAAVHRTPGHPDHEYFDTNVAGATHVTEFCSRLDATRLIFLSSISVYGPSERPVTEDTPPAPTSAYGESKLTAEQIHAEWLGDDSRRRLVVARPATVFGPGEGGNFTRLAAALRKRRFVYPGRRDTVKACGYVRDLVDALVFVEGLDRRSVTFNFGLREPPTIEAICHAFCRIGGFARPRVVIPTPVLLAAAKALKAVGATDYDEDRVMKLVRSTHVVPEVLIREGFPYRFTLDEALADWYEAAPASQFV